MQNYQKILILTIILLFFTNFVFAKSYFIEKADVQFTINKDGSIDAIEYLILLGNIIIFQENYLLQVIIIGNILILKFLLMVKVILLKQSLKEVVHFMSGIIK